MMVDLDEHRASQEVDDGVNFENGRGGEGEKGGGVEGFRWEAGQST